MEETNESGYSEGRKHTLTANELRISNWVKLKDSPTTPYWQVESVGNLIIVGGQLWSIEELEPIPLTEELLVKFGFVKHGVVFLHKDGHLLEINAYGCNGNIGYCLDHERGIYKEIKFIHKLQNICFELEGKELTQ